MYSLTANYEQMSFDEQISKVGALPLRDPEKFIELMKAHFDLPTFIPRSFYHAYYNSQTNDRGYPLESMLSIVQEQLKQANPRPQTTDYMELLQYEQMIWSIADESGLNREYRRIYACAKRGVKVYGKKSGKKVKKVNIVAGLLYGASGKRHIAVHSYYNDRAKS